MYIPSHFEQPQTEAMHRLIRERPLATLVTPSDEGLTADHLPLHLSSDPGDLGTLRGHIARNNPLWRGTAHEMTALAVFTGPDSYISPSWYPTKREHGKAVPTWNYLAVHASGTLRFIEDAAVKFTSTS